MKSSVLFITLSLLTATSFVTPVKADQAVIQENKQEAVITGKGNYSSQQIRQENQINQSRRRGNSQGIIQRTEQGTDILGDYNDSIQKSVQINRTRNNSTPRR